MKKLFKYVLLFLVGAATMQSCTDIEDEYTYGKGLYTIDWNAAADSATASLITHFWDAKRHFFVYNSNEFDNAPMNNYWPQAHAMDVIIDAYLRTNDSKYSAMFDQWFEGVKKQNYSNPGVNYRNNFYDDSQWIGLTMVRLYDATKDTKYLDAAEDLMEWIKTGWNDLGNGGIAWERTSHQADKNSCSNGPAAILAAELYQRTNKEDYLEWAKKIYEWEQTYLFNQATGAVYNGLNGNTGAIDELSLSYNQGTFVGAAHLLYQITKEKTYLNAARKAAYFGITNSGNIDTSNNVLRDEGNTDGGLFKGIFMRYFLPLMTDPDLDPVYTNKFATFFKNNAEVLWRNGVNKTEMLIGPNWASKVQGTTTVTSHTCGCTMVELRAAYEKLMKK